MDGFLRKISREEREDDGNDTCSSSEYEMNFENYNNCLIFTKLTMYSFSSIKFSTYLLQYCFKVFSTEISCFFITNSEKLMYQREKGTPDFNRQLFQ